MIRIGIAKGQFEAPAELPEALFAFIGTARAFVCWCNAPLPADATSKAVFSEFRRQLVTLYQAALALPSPSEEALPEAAEPRTASASASDQNHFREKLEMLDIRRYTYSFLPTRDFDVLTDGDLWDDLLSVLGWIKLGLDRYDAGQPAEAWYAWWWHLGGHAGHHLASALYVMQAEATSATGSLDEMTDDKKMIAAHDAFVASLRGRWPWQVHPHTYIATGPGWWPEITRVCEYVGELITDPRDRAILAWVQIKEKLGGLRMYADVTRQVMLPFDDEEARAYTDLLRMHIDPARLAETRAGPLEVALCIPRPLVEQLLARIQQAEAVCWHTCETCGVPGELYRKGWHQVCCPEHAKQKQERDSDD